MRSTIVPLNQTVYARLARCWLALLGLLLGLGCSNIVGSGSAPSGVHPTAGPGRPPTSGSVAVPTGSNVNLGGSQDIGFFRSQLNSGLVPDISALDAAGFFAEHHQDLPPPACGKRVCLQPMLAVMGNLFNGSNCTMLQLALNTPITADPAARPPLSLAVVVDVSGSMQGEKLQYVKQGLEILIDKMRDGDRLALVSYSDSARVLAPMAPVELQRVSLRAQVRSLVADGGTNIALGLETGYHAVLNSIDRSRQNRVILLSDGVPTVGVTSTSAIIGTSRSYNSEGIGITTVGLGLDFNVDLMRNLALQADGNFYFLENTGAIQEVFQEELDFFTVPVAFDLSMQLTTGDAYSFGRAVGSPFFKTNPNGGSLDVPSVFIAHRTSNQDVTSQNGRRGGGSALLIELLPRPDAANYPETIVAHVNLSFRDPLTQEIVTDSIDIKYPFQASFLSPTGHFQGENVKTVQKSFVMLNILTGMERVIQAFHSGRANQTSITELDRLIAAVTDYNQEVGDVDIRLDLDLMGQLRANLLRAGVPAPASASQFGDPWPAD